jgi:hypothetical protein
MKPERVEAIYSELETLVIELAADPASLGPGYLQDLISRTRGYLNKTSIFQQEILREQYILEREMVALEAAYEVSSDALLADDNRVTRLPNIDDRKAMINLILREEKVRILDLKRQIRDLSFVEKVVKHRHKELDNTMAALRMQKSLMDTEVRTGSYYGDESEASRNRGSARIRTDDIDEDELSQLLGDVLVSQDSAPTAQVLEEAETSPVEPTPQSVGEIAVDGPNSNSEDPDISKFLDGDDDLDAILNSV